MKEGVHQLVPVLSEGDAIGAATLRTQEVLRSLGFDSEIFVERADAQHSEAHAASELLERVGRGSTLLYRLSIGSPVSEIFNLIPGRKVLVYHNITPPWYYVGTNREVAYWLQRGRLDLSRIAPISDLVIADSTYNMVEARSAGAKHCVVIPPPIDLARLSPRQASGSRPPRILFVGRFAPNKRHDVLMRALAALRATSSIDAQLVMLGSATGSERHLSRLEAFAQGLGISEATTLTGKRVTDSTLADAYAHADVFATASEHEGFCVPAVEAMAFSVPVVAYAAAAVPETVDRAAALLHTHDPLVWAATLERILSDVDLRRALVEAGRRRVDYFSERRYSERLAKALSSIGITP
jgi:glycosyltransferase involved in cell wall biosynthesis